MLRGICSMIDEEMEEVEFEIEDDIPFITISNVKVLLNKAENISFKDMIISTFVKLKQRGFLNHDKTVEQIDDIKNSDVNVEDFRATDTDFRTFLEAMSRLDADKARLSDMMSSAQNDYDTLEALYKDLRVIWISRSTGKSSDKREGEATEILFFLTSERLKRKCLLNKVKTRFISISAQLDTISREITIGQELRKHQV